MRATNAVKEYINYEISQKAASAIRDANDRCNNADKAADAAYNKLTLIVDMCGQAELENVGDMECCRCGYDGTPCHCQADETRCIKMECR